jgi:hypothetical protein
MWLPGAVSVQPPRQRVGSNFGPVSATVPRVGIGTRKSPVQLTTVGDSSLNWALPANGSGGSIGRGAPPNDSGCRADECASLVSPGSDPV